MANRRPLVEGLAPVLPAVDPKKEHEFVYGDKSRPAESAKPAAISAHVSRTPMSTRIRSDFFAALKRASLERQLEGKEPNTLIEILEEAVEPWLKSNGYLS